MQTRETSPFPIVECDDNNCNNTVPKSTRRNLCTTCQNVSQTLGERPSNVDSASIEKVTKEGSPTKYGFILTVNGNDQEYMWLSEKSRDMRFREYKIPVRNATEG